MKTSHNCLINFRMPNNFDYFSFHKAFHNVRDLNARTNGKFTRKHEIKEENRMSAMLFLNNESMV